MIWLSSINGDSTGCDPNQVKIKIILIKYQKMNLFVG